MATTHKVSPDQIIDMLTARPGATAAELAEALGLGQSTAAKHLAALEAKGTIRREPGGREAGRRLPDRWTATTSEVERPAPGAPGKAHEEPTDAGDSTDGAPGPSDRLGRGALGALVREYLAARVDEDLGATQVGKGLGRSQGAVSNALARLEAAGEARLVSTSPRRYRIVIDR
ncbi:MAG: MarR family transcriptional regulator [Thermoplasmata archaeon]